MKRINKNSAYKQEVFQEGTFCRVSACNFPAVLSSISVHKSPFPAYKCTAIGSIHPTAVWILLKSGFLQAADSVKVQHATLYFLFSEINK